MALMDVSRSKLLRRIGLKGVWVGLAATACLVLGVSVYVNHSRNLATQKNAATSGATTTSMASGASQSRSAADKLTPVNTDTSTVKAAGSTAETPDPVPVVASNGLTAALYSGLVTPSGNFTVRVYENSGSTEVNAVQLKLGYNPGELGFVSANQAGPFALAAATDTGVPGMIRIARATSSPTTGVQPVIDLTFTVKSGMAGSVALHFDSSGSALVRSADATNILQTASDVKFSVKPN